MVLWLIGGCFVYCVCWFIAVAVSGVLGVRGLGVSCCCGWGSCVDFLSWFGLVGWLICGF